MTRRKQPVLVGLHKAFPQSRFFRLDRTDLDSIVETLNWKPEGGVSLYGEPLARLIGRLRRYEGDLRKMMDDDLELEKVIKSVCVTEWMPSRKGRAYLVPQPSWEHILKRKLSPGQVDRMRPERFAALLFHVGTLNPEWDKLAGPCVRCGNYYIKKRASQKVYCSRRCGNAATALARTSERIKAERADKIGRAKAAIKEWKAAKPQRGWKHWVSERTAIDLRFLTRNFTETGELKTPQKESR